MPQPTQKEITSGYLIRVERTNTINLSGVSNRQPFNRYL